MRRTDQLPVVCVLALMAGAALAPAAYTEPKPPGPCDTPECRQFDFWIGDWEVRTPDGRLAGTNRIEKILDGCVLQESWVGAHGMRGRSLNMYSAADHRWHQTWMDTNGLLLALAGEFKNGRMVLAGDTPKADGTVVTNRITWRKLADGRVRQHWETSADGGTTWSDAFVGLYSRKPKPGGSR